MIKALTASDQELTRQSLQTMLNNRPDIMVTDTVSNEQEIICSVRKNKPDTILMDIRMPKLDGVQYTETIKENYPQIKTIILITPGGDEYVYNALKCGASGYLSKGVSTDELTNAITTVYNGWTTINLGIATKALRLFSQMVQADYTILVGDKDMDELIKTEQKTIAQVEKRASNREIAEALKLSKGTVRSYLSTILNKLDLRDRTQLIIWAVQTNIRERLGIQDWTMSKYAGKGMTRCWQEEG